MPGSIRSARANRLRLRAMTMERRLLTAVVLVGLGLSFLTVATNLGKTFTGLAERISHEGR